MAESGLKDPRVTLGGDLADAAGERVINALDAVRPVLYLVHVKEYLEQ